MTKSHRGFLAITATSDAVHAWLSNSCLGGPRSRSLPAGRFEPIVECARIWRPVGSAPLAAFHPRPQWASTLGLRVPPSPVHVVEGDEHWAAMHAAAAKIGKVRGPSPRRTRSPISCFSGAITHQPQYLFEELLGDAGSQQSLPILVEHRHVPHRLVDVQADEPPKQIPTVPSTYVHYGICNSRARSNFSGESTAGRCRSTSLRTPVTVAPILCPPFDGPHARGGPTGHIAQATSN